MKCIVCDRCNEIIKNPRHSHVITCARPLKPQIDNCGGKTAYRGNDRQQNDIIWEKELCDNCLDKLESFFETESDSSDETGSPSDGDEPVQDDGADT